MEASENKPEFVIDDDTIAPPALSRHLASVSLRSISNDLTEGFDVAMSAHTSGDFVTLMIGDSELEVFFELLQFEVDLQFSNLRIGFGPEYQELAKEAELRSIVTRDSKTEVAGSVSGSIDVGPKPNVSGAISGKRMGATTSEVSASRILREYSHIDIGCVSAGDFRSGRPIVGPIIADYAGWSVTPKFANESSGVLARLRAKRPWMKISDPKVKSTVGTIARRLRTLFASQDEGEKLKVAVFPILLEKLVHLKLQEPTEKDFATVAASCLVARPRKFDAEILPSAKRTEPISVDLTTVKDFLDIEPENVQSFLANIEAATESDLRDGVIKPRALETDSKPSMMEISNKLPVGRPRELLSLMSSIRRAFLTIDADVSMNAFGDIPGIDELVDLRIVEIEIPFIKGIDLSRNEDLDLALAERVLENPKMKRAYRAFRAIVPERPEDQGIIEGRINYGDEVRSYKIHGASEASISSAVASEFELQHPLQDAELELFLWEWCEFIHESLVNHNRDI